MGRRSVTLKVPFISVFITVGLSWMSAEQREGWRRKKDKQIKQIKLTSSFNVMKKPAVNVSRD